MFATFALLTLLVSAPEAQKGLSKDAKTFDFYVIDVEGGAATLLVSPSGESVMIDSGNPGARDTDRIVAVLAEVGVKEIDYLVSTHYHVDHIGGIQELAKRVAIKHYIDHGPSSEEREQVAGFQAAYAELYGKAKHTVVKPGDKLPIAGLDWRIVTAAGKAMKTPLPGGGKPNPSCADFKPKDANPLDENGMSVGSVISFGKFRMIDLGDLLWNREFDLMCPTNPIGTIDLYIVSHHGTDPSGSPVLVHGLQPRVAISQNGTRKGGTLQTAQTLNSSPGFQDHWQMHWSYNAGTEFNPAGLFIANIDDPAVIAAVLTAPPQSAGGGRGGQGAGTPPSPVGIPTPASVSPGAVPTPVPVTAPPPVAVSPGAVPPPVPISPGAVPTPMPSPVSPPAGAAQPPAAGPGQPGVAPPAGAPGGRQGGGGRGGPGQPHVGPAFLIKVSVQADGTFTVTNTRNGFSRTYKPR
jgi:beta-lactamase superfamily II metal-dependent hydrolase